MKEGKNKTKKGIVVGKLGGVSKIRTFFDGSTRSHETLNSAVIGLGTCKPGWRWSLRAGPQAGKSSENHIGYVVSGLMMVKDPDGTEANIGPGEAFEISAGSDA